VLLQCSRKLCRKWARRSSSVAMLVLLGHNPIEVIAKFNRRKSATEGSVFHMPKIKSSQGECDDHVSSYRVSLFFIGPTFYPRAWNA
jgi:hypothetical protein